MNTPIRKLNIGGRGLAAGAVGVPGDAALNLGNRLEHAGMDYKLILARAPVSRPPGGVAFRAGKSLTRIQLAARRKRQINDWSAGVSVAIQSSHTSGQAGHWRSSQFRTSGPPAC